MSEELTYKTAIISLWSELHLLRGEVSRLTDILACSLNDEDRERLNSKWDAAREGRERSVGIALSKLNDDGKT